MVFITRAQPHAQSLFLFPIVFGINLVHFFDEKKDGAAGNSIVFFFRCFDPLSRHLTKNGNCFEECNVSATESVNLAPFKMGETKVHIFGKEKCKILRQY